jgi:YidC/Oxa1 family membrane protein insertase
MFSITMQEQNTDWKRYFLFLTIAFILFAIYDTLVIGPKNNHLNSNNQTTVASKDSSITTPNSPHSLTVSQKNTKNSDKGTPINLYLGSFREKAQPKEFITLNFPDTVIKIAVEGAKIYSFYDKRFKKDLVENYEKTLNIYPLEILTEDWKTTKILNFEKYNCRQINKNTVKCSLQWKGNKYVEKIFSFTEKGYISNIKITLKGIKKPFLYIGMNPAEKAFYTHIGPILKTAEGKTIRIDMEDIKTPSVLYGNFVWEGEEGRYFLKAVKYPTEEVVIFKVLVNATENQYASATAVRINPDKNDTAHFIFFGGPKEYELLKKLDFVSAIDFGMLSFITYPTFMVLYFFYKIFHSWTASIFFLTLLIRILFFPLSISSTVSMKKMQDLAPKLEEIRKKYAQDPRKMQEEMLKLYKEIGFNPFSGCLPLLLQIPIFFALYKVLIVTADLSLEGFLWVPSLAERDPYYILPIIMGLTMIAQSFITPSPNKQQNTLMYAMAIAFTILFATFPAGLILYWILNNIFNILQTFIIYKKFAK